MAGPESNGHRDADYVALDYRDDVAVLTLRHPQDANALSLAMTTALTGAVARVDTEGRAHALVIASGGAVFCSGGSLDDLLSPQAPLEEMYAGFVAVATCRVPTVAAVNGPALGAGLNLALAADLIVCSPEARFETRFLDVGLHPGGGHLWLLRERIGRQGTAAMALFGASLGGVEAVQRGLAWRCVAEGELVAEAVGLAGRAARLDPELVARTRATLAEGAAVHDLSGALALELPAQRWSMGRAEFATRLARLRARLGRADPPG